MTETNKPQGTQKVPESPHPQEGHSWPCRYNAPKEVICSRIQEKMLSDLGWLGVEAKGTICKRHQ